MILMIPSFSKRMAPVNCSRHNSTRRATRSMSRISPSSITPPPIRCKLSHARVQLVVQDLSHFFSEHVDQILRRGLLYAGHTSEPFDQNPPPLVADARQIIELAVQNPLRSSAPMRRDREAMRFVAHHLQDLQRGIA